VGVVSALLHGSTVGAVGRRDTTAAPVFIWDPTMPFKSNTARRHHIPNQKRKVMNWAAYDASLRQRGSLTAWLTEEAITAWRAAPRTARGGQAWFSPLAILTALT
jgi:hypothetical protein